MGFALSWTGKQNLQGFSVYKLTDDLGAEAYHQPQNQVGEEWDKFYILFTPSIFLFPTTIILGFFLPQVCGWDTHLFRQCYMETSEIIK